MKVRALRGVCIGVDRHLSAGDTADLDPATGKFLVVIKAVEEVAEPLPPQADESPPATAEASSENSPDASGDLESKSMPAKPGKKEK